MGDGRQIVILGDVGRPHPDPTHEVIRIDQVTGALMTIDYAHHEMHGGSHYFSANTVDITGAGTVVYFMFRTPNSVKRMHTRAVFTAEAEFIIEIYEGATVSADGTPVVTFNNDRDSENTPLLEAFAAPTVTDDGTQMWANTVGSGRNATGIAPGLDYEIIAKTDTVYLFKITKETSGTHYINYDFFWYEHTPRS